MINNGQYNELYKKSREYSIESKVKLSEPIKHSQLFSRAMIWTHPPFYPATKMSQNGRVNQNLSEGESNEEYYCIRRVYVLIKLFFSVSYKLFQII